VSLRWNFGPLNRAIKSLAAIPSKAAEEAARGISAELKGEFAAGSDPYRRPWARLRPSTIKRKGHSRPMIDKGKAKSTTKAVPLRGAGIALQTDADYLRFHQGESGKRPPRPVFRNQAQLPRRWLEIIEKAIKSALGPTR